MMSVSVGPAKRSMPTLPEQLALCLGDVGVPRPDQHVHGLDGLRPDRHRRNRLNAAETADDVGARQMLRRNNRRRRPAAVRRRAGQNGADTGDLGRHHRHVGRCEQRVFPTRHIASHRRDRDVLMPKDHARKRLDLQVQHRGTLLLREVTDLRLCEANVLEISRRKLGEGFPDFLVGQAKVAAVPVIEAHRQFSNRRIPAVADLGEYVLDRFSDDRAAFGKLRRIPTLLQPLCHERPVSSRTSEDEPSHRSAIISKARGYAPSHRDAIFAELRCPASVSLAGSQVEVVAKSLFGDHFPASRFTMGHVAEAARQALSYH